ncbi:MAG: hypothetical protein PHT19_01550 [Methylococcus sp.]|nr:hypothetical protein [Methylococcus sp.]
MKTTRDYIEAAKASLGIQSDYALAKWLGVSKATASHWKSGRSTVDDYAAVRIAAELKIDPIEVIAVANLEREKDEKRRDFWRTFCPPASPIAGTLLFAVSSAYTVKAQVLDLIECILC